MDGVTLSEAGARTIRDLIKAHSEGGKVKRQYRKRKNADGELINHENTLSIRVPVNQTL